MARYFCGEYFLLVGILTLASCAGGSSKQDITDNTFQYRQYFSMDSIESTLDPRKDEKRLVELNELPDALGKLWMTFFEEPNGMYQGLSYQYGTPQYHVILVAIIDDLYIDENGHSSILSSSQYLLTVKSDGKLIDGLKVQERLSRDRLGDDLVNGMEVMWVSKEAKFVDRTITVFDKTSYIKTTVLSEREDYIDTPDGKKLGTLEKILKEEYEGTDEVTYNIDEEGKIVNRGEKKGALKKLSEHSGEVIKGDIL